MQALHERRQAADVVAVLVRDQYGVQRGRVFADGRQPPGKFAVAESGVEQNSRARGRKERGVARTAARKYTDLQNTALPPGLFLVSGIPPRKQPRRMGVGGDCLE
jgi:hypothetical protein